MIKFFIVAALVFFAIGIFVMFWVPIVAILLILWLLKLIFGGRTQRA